MKSINLKKEVIGTMNEVVERVTAALKVEGFGVLTRIDLHEKIKEKLGNVINPVVILGACNPKLAYEAYQKNSDVACLLPCNAVVRDLGNNRISVELAKPSALMEMINDQELVDLSKDADHKLQKALDTL